jgi:hypothetical protein
MMLAFALQGVALGLAMHDDEDGLPMVTGSDGVYNPGQNQLEQRTGMRPYTMRLPGTRTRVNYGKIEPLATALGFATDFAHAIRKQAKGAKLSELLDDGKNALLGQVMEKSALVGLSDATTALRVDHGSDSKLARWASSLATSWIPNVIRQPGGTIDPLYRDNHNNADEVSEYWWNAGKRTVAPWTRHPKISVWGEEIRKTDSAPATDAMFRVLRAVSPIDANTMPEVNPLDRAIINWNSDPTRKPYYPSPASPKYMVDGVPREMTDAQYERYARAAGKRAAELLEGRIDPENVRESDIKLMRAKISRARRFARLEIIRDASSSADDEGAEADR